MADTHLTTEQCAIARELHSEIHPTGWWCGVTPCRTYDALTQAIERAVNRQENEVIAERDRLLIRQQELLEIIRRLSQEIPLPEEIAEALATRGKLMAEIGTLRSEMTELRTGLRDQLAQTLALLRDFYVAYHKPEWESGTCAEEMTASIRIYLDAACRKGWQEACVTPISRDEISIGDPRKE